MKKGIDMSYAQGKIDWSKVKTDFCIIRAGYGRLMSQRDKYFDANYKGCKENKIPCGAYWYSYAMSEAEAIEEAKACLSVIKGKTFEYPIYFDLEEKKQFDLGKAKCSAIAKAFLETVEKAGYWVGLYMSKSPLESYITEDIRKRYAVWVAQYNDICTYKGDYGIWQYSGSSKAGGVSGSVDGDYGYVDYPTLIKNKCLNGFKKQTAQTVTASAKTTATVKPSPSFKKGDKVKVKSGSKTYGGNSLAAFVYKNVYTVMEISGDRIVIGLKGVVTAAVHKNSLTKA